MRRRPGPVDGQGRGRRRHRGRAELLRRRSAPRRRQGLRQGLRADPEDLQPEPRARADEAQQPEEGPRRGPRFRRDLVGRGAVGDRRQAQRGACRGPARRVGLSARGRQLRRRRHAAVLHGHLPRLPLRVGAGGHGFRLGPGRQVLPLRAPVRRAVAPRVHRRRRHAQLQLPDLLRQQHRGRGRRGGRLAALEGARARHEARAGRAAPVDHRRLLGAVGADPAEDRRRLPVRADPRDAARGAARAARPAAPGAAHQLALSGRAARLLPARARDAQAAGLGRGRGPRHAARRARHPRGLERQRAGRCGRDRRRRRRAGRRPARRPDRVRQARRAHGAVHARVGAGRLRRARGDDAQDRPRVPGSRLHRPDGRDQRQGDAVPAGGGDAGQDRQQRLGRLRMLLGAHAAGHAGRRARGARRHDRHHGAAGQADVRAARQRQARPRRADGLPVQPDVQGALVGAAEHPQRLQDDGAAGRQQRLGAGAGADAFFVDVPRRHAQGAAEGRAAGRVVRLPHQSGDLVLGHAGHRHEDRALSVRRRLRLHARREQPLRRHPAARRHRPGRAAAAAAGRHQVPGAVLGPRGLRAAPAGGQGARPGARLHRDLHRARAALRPAREVQRGDQPRHLRRAAEGRLRRLLARRRPAAHA